MLKTACQRFFLLYNLHGLSSEHDIMVCRIADNAGIVRRHSIKLYSDAPIIYDVDQVKD